MSQLSRILSNIITLQKGEEDKQKVLEAVKENISFRNANLWILACAILIASVGLNVNSTAVIIGAMLISPLMGPIVGAGFALGTYDFELLQKAGKNLLIATIVSLLVATLYFFISPFKETQSELLARTSPNIYDVLIAFFGGTVGAISVTRRNKGNPIPGVAIATALMPPLCTAGYGIAIGNFQYFAGAFYLYTINCFFICIATFFITKYLKYPAVTSINLKHSKRIKRGITIMILIMILPSFYLAYDLFNEKKYIQKVEDFLSTEFTEKGDIIIYKRTNFKSRPKEIELAFLSKTIDSPELKQYQKKLESYELTNTKLIIRQDVRDIKGEILEEINGEKTLLSSKDLEIELLRKELSLFKMEDPGLMKEIRILFPNLTNISLGRHNVILNNDSSVVRTILLYNSTQNTDAADTAKLRAWLTEKMKIRDIQIVREN